MSLPRDQKQKGTPVLTSHDANDQDPPVLHPLESRLDNPIYTCGFEVGDAL